MVAKRNEQKFKLGKTDLAQKSRTPTLTRLMETACHRQLPFHFASAIDKNRGNKATLLRSPDRVIGLADATRKSTRAFDLSEAMAFAGVKDSRFVLLTCLPLGLGVWWYLLPEPLLVQPTACCSPECASVIKEAAQCQMRSLGFPCIHKNDIHDQVMDTFTKLEVFRSHAVNANGCA